MPNCAKSYESEISEGKNARSVKCKYCGSIILTPSSGNFTSFEFKLPLIKQRVGSENDPETEDVSLFWAVDNMYKFENVGFSNMVENLKYLTCADCEAGPIGYHDTISKTSYVALCRVQHE